MVRYYLLWALDSTALHETDPLWLHFQSFDIAGSYLMENAAVPLLGLNEAVMRMFELDLAAMFALRAAFVRMLELDLTVLFGLMTVFV